MVWREESDMVCTSDGVTGSVHTASQKKAEMETNSFCFIVVNTLILTHGAVVTCVTIQVV